MDVSQKYAQTEVSGMKQSELESRALIKTASQLNLIKENWEEKVQSWKRRWKKIENYGQFLPRQ